MTPRIQSFSPVRMWAQLGEFLEAIKFSHSVFALPFALIAMLLARQGQLPEVREWVWIIAAMVGARTWAMVVNRIVDAHLDARNPRTATRTLPAGRMSVGVMWAYGLGGAALLLASAAALSPVALACAVPLLAILASYSYTKRFTWLCHFWLGFCLGLAPLGAWVALRGELSWRIAILTAAISGWVAGFDIIYALQDEDFDRTAKLWSIPSRFGARKALVIAQASHLAAGLLFVTFGILFKLGTTYFLGLTVACALMVAEHWLVRDGNLKKINVAFFNLNGWISVLLLCATAASLLLNGQF